MEDTFDMAKILFLVSSFLPETDANGACVYNLAKALIAKGHTVYCISEKEEGLHECESIEDIATFADIKAQTVENYILNAYENK